MFHTCMYAAYAIVCVFCLLIGRSWHNNWWINDVLYVNSLYMYARVSDLPYRAWGKCFIVNMLVNRHVAWGNEYHILCSVCCVAPVTSPVPFYRYWWLFRARVCVWVCVCGVWCVVCVCVCWGGGSPFHEESTSRILIDHVYMHCISL